MLCLEKGKAKIMNLLQALRSNENWTQTENGALTPASTLSDVLDFWYHIGGMRGQDVTRLFSKAYAENEVLAIKAAFNSRDVRGGKGERESFRQVLRYLFNNDRAVFNSIVVLVPEFGRWDDVVEFVDSDVVRAMVANRLDNDKFSDNPSLLAKWMPSANTSSDKTVELAYKWMRILDLQPRSYRKLLVSLRKKIEIVESLMSAKAFNKINYKRVPSRAGMIYRKAFSKQDGTRYVQYLEDVKSGKTTINSSTLFPHEIVSKYLNGSGKDDTLEAQWKALPNYCEDNDQNALVVCDVSGSMSGVPMEVSIALGIYIAERNTGIFKDHFITFSERPTLERLVGNTLHDRVRNLQRAQWDMNTNIQAVFDLILSTALSNGVKTEGMPKKIFIISDMQFDSASSRNKTNFKEIERKYKLAGYEMPTLIFWNVRDSANTPVTKDQNGVFLVSGYSPSIFKNAINAKAVTPEEMMLEVLNSARYDAVGKALV
jgi:hypothetical protein